MTREDITRMAREADVWVAGQEPYQTQLERFAALVVAAENEACAVILDENAMACENPIYRSLLQSNAQAVRARRNT